MDNNDLSIQMRMRELYGLDPDIPHVAFQFPRVPPTSFGTPMPTPQPSIHNSQDSTLTNQKLYEFQHTFRQHASRLLTTGSPVIPPGHPLYNNLESVKALEAERDKLQKENTDLKKKLEVQKNNS